MQETAAEIRALLKLLLLSAVAAGCGGADPGTLGTESSAASRAAATSLVATPNPVPAGQALHLSGCGYAAGLAVIVKDSGPAGTDYWSAVADATGCFSLDHGASTTTGSYTLGAYQQLKRGQSTLLAQVSLTVSPAPLTTLSESYFFRWDAIKNCVSEDDTLDWSAMGYLAPGQSFTFTPRYPDCKDARAVMVKVTADTGASLRVSTVVPLPDGISNDPGQQGKTIVADTAGGLARLCMFPNSSYSLPTGYTITVTNVGTTTASTVGVTGKDYNDWPIFYWSECLGADADHDGWSDSYEHAMAQLVYPTGNYINGALPAGSNYLASCGTAQANDEFDFWPPDLDDDGVVTQADVNLLAAHLGEGNGIPWASISPNSGVPEAYWNHVGAWNRFDLNADGYVDAKDLAIVQGLLGTRCGP